MTIFQSWLCRRSSRSTQTVTNKTAVRPKKNWLFEYFDVTTAELQNALTDQAAIARTKATYSSTEESPILDGLHKEQATDSQRRAHRQWDTRLHAALTSVTASS